MTDTTHRLELASWDRDALLLEDTAADRLALLPELMRREERTREDSRLTALLAEEDAMLARWAEERALEEAADAL